MRRALALLILASCLARAPSVPKHEPEPEPEPVTVPDLPLPLALPLTAVPIPTATGCLVHAEQHGPRALRPRPAAAPYATVTATNDERVLFPEGAASTPYVELETAGGALRLRGYVDVAPHATRPIVLSGVVWPRKRTRLVWLGTTAEGEMRVAVGLPDGVTVDGGGVATATVSCAALTVLDERTSAYDFRPDDHPHGTRVSVRQPTPLRSAYDGPVRALVTGPGGTAYAGETRAAWRSVQIDYGDVILRGWVPAKLVGYDLRGIGNIGSRGYGGRYSVSPGLPACDASVAVFAQTAQGFVEVGAVAALAPLRRFETSGDYTRIEVGSEHEEAGKLPWYARTADVVGCNARSAASGAWHF